MENLFGLMNNEVKEENVKGEGTIESSEEHNIGAAEENVNDEVNGDENEGIKQEEKTVRVLEKEFNELITISLKEKSIEKQKDELREIIEKLKILISEIDTSSKDVKFKRNASLALEKVKLLEQIMNISNELGFTNALSLVVKQLNEYTVTVPKITPKNTSGPSKTTTKKAPAEKTISIEETKISCATQVFIYGQPWGEMIEDTSLTFNDIRKMVEQERPEFETDKTEYRYYSHMTPAQLIFSPVNFNKKG